MSSIIQKAIDFDKPKHKRDNFDEFNCLLVSIATTNKSLCRVVAMKYLVGPEISVYSNFDAGNLPASSSSRSILDSIFMFDNAEKRRKLGLLSNACNENVGVVLLLGSLPLPFLSIALPSKISTNQLDEICSLSTTTSDDNNNSNHYKANQLRANQLREFHATYCSNLTQIPGSICTFAPNLKIISLRDSFILRFPKYFFPLRCYAKQLLILDLTCTAVCDETFSEGIFRVDSSSSEKAEVVAPCLHTLLLAETAVQEPFLKFLTPNTTPNLQVCDLCKVEKVDLKGISQTSLTALDVSFCSLKFSDNLRDMALCTSLKYLDLSHNRVLFQNVHLIDFGTNLINLIELNLEYTGIEKINQLGLQNSKTLRILDLSECDELRSIDGLQNVKSLEILKLNSCWKLNEDLSSLILMKNEQQQKEEEEENAFPNLRILEISSSKFVDENSLAGLQLLPNLHVLEAMTSENLKDVSFLSSSESLIELNVSFCYNLISLKNLEKIKTLCLLDITGCSKMLSSLENKQYDDLMSDPHLHIKK